MREARSEGGRKLERQGVRGQDIRKARSEGARNQRGKE